MLVQAAGIYELGHHAKLTDDCKMLIIREQIGSNESQTIDVFVRLTPQLAREIDFALSVYSQELEHGTPDLVGAPPAAPQGGYVGDKMNDALNAGAAAGRAGAKE